MVSVRSVVRAVTLSVALLVLTASSPASAQKTPNALDNTDLLDLLDAELDESFLTKAAPHRRNVVRFLQGEFLTAAPTPAPTTSSRDIGTSSPTVSDREITTEPTTASTTSPTANSGTASPTANSGTASPTAAPDGATDQPVISGVWRPVPSAAIAFAAVVLAVLSGGAIEV